MFLQYYHPQIGSSDAGVRIICTSSSEAGELRDIKDKCVLEELAESRIEHRYALRPSHALAGHRAPRQYEPEWLARQPQQCIIGHSKSTQRQWPRHGPAPNSESRSQTPFRRFHVLCIQVDEVQEPDQAGLPGADAPCLPHRTSLRNSLVRLRG